MKRILLLAALVFGAIQFTSCEKDVESTFYYYTNSFQLSNKSDVKGISDVLDHKLNHVFEFTESEAKAEWDNFLKSVDESSLVFQAGEYYTVTFSRLEINGDRMVPAETIGTKTWSNK